MKILYHKRFLKRLRKCSPVERELVAKKIELFADNPLDPTLRNHELHAPYSDYRSIDVRGDLLALYTHINQGLVEFGYLGTHHELYGT